MMGKSRSSKMHPVTVHIRTSDLESFEHGRIEPECRLEPFNDSIAVIVAKSRIHHQDKKLIIKRA